MFRPVPPNGGSALAVAPKLSVLAPNQIPQGIYQATATPAQLIKGGYWVGGKLFAPPEVRDLGREVRPCVTPAGWLVTAPAGATALPFQQ